MPTIRKLDDHVISQINTHLELTSIDTILDRLLTESLNRNSTRILINVDLISPSLYLHDDGEVYNPAQLESIPSSSSKSHGPNPSLYAISAVSDFSIISKCQTYNCAYEVKLSDTSLVAQMYTTRQDKKSGLLERKSHLPVEPAGTKNSFGNLPVEPAGTKNLFGNLPVEPADGTIYSVKNLFGNLPVRKEQLRSTPQYKILNKIKTAILSRLLNVSSSVHLTLSVLNQQCLQFQPKCIVNLKQSNCVYEQLLGDIFGIDIGFTSIKAAYEGYKVSGVIGLRAVNSKAHQYVFVNNRLISLTNKVASVFNEIFISSSFFSQDVSPTKSTGKIFYKFPCFLINVKCDNKQNFQEEPYSWSVIVNIISKLFNKFVSLGEPPRNENETKRFTFSPSPIKPKSDNSKSSGSTSEKEIKISRQGLAPQTELNRFPCDENHHYVVPLDKSVRFEKFQLRSGKYRIIRQIENKFILLLLYDNENTLVVLDQHASDERVKVECMIQQFVKIMRGNPGLRLAKSLMLTISNDEIQFFKQYMSNFKLFGVEYDITDCDSLAIIKLPEILLSKVGNDAEFIRDVLLQHCYDLNNKVKNQTFNLDDWFAASHNLPKAILDIITSKACRSAIMFGDKLDEQEMSRLIENLSRCRLPFQCAHGRPSVVPLARIVQESAHYRHYRHYRAERDSGATSTTPTLSTLSSRAR
ncbi:MLH3 [Candida oxycetoniae]|uniref:MLH3 n=1 Tax=Candida oxycetoniae TaxID=497107 RepID=A0AAI9SUQ3_9ASCO|nr:MLH3 [Candida oxycetoniae]KAI3403241.2 MLH3 [Candida oxycetoniae]